MKFKKIATVLGSALMVGSTLGLAAAAAYPAPFVSNGAANVAIVVGTAGAEASDMVAATDISADLAKDLSAQAVGGVKTVTGGESFKLDKSSDKFNFADTLNEITGTLDSEDLDFLADGNYKDGNVDEDYEQTITLSSGSEALALFTDKDFKNDAPTVGFWFSNNENVLSYTIEFDAGVNATEMVETDLPLLGKEYYVLSATTSKITLLDSANKKVLADGESVTIDGKEVSVEWIDATDVKLNINGEVTDKMNEGDAEELDDGSYVVVTDIMASDRESTVQKVEFSLGAGKIILENTKEVIMGEDSNDEVDGLVATIGTSSSLIDSITLTWNSNDDTFLAEGNPLTMPGLGVLGLTFDGLNYPADSEKISIENGETLTLMMDNFDLPLMWYNDVTSAYVQGEENYPLIMTNTTTVDLYDTNASNSNNVTTTGSGLVLTEDDRFVATLIDTDLSDVESLYYEVKTAENDSGTGILVELTDLIGNDDKTFESIGDTAEVGEVTMTLRGVNNTNNKALIGFSGNVVFNKVVSDKGLVVTIPTAAENEVINFTEANNDGDVNTGANISVTVKNSTNDKLYVQYSGAEEVSTDKYTDVIASDLASIISTDESGDEYDFSVEYFGAEVTADVMVTVGGVVSESDSSLGTVTVLDSEADKMTGKNLIVVGGNCVNSVAASLLGLSAGASCMADFSAKTGVANGGYLIQSFDKAGKVALLVAGYSAADTTKAKTYLVNNNVETMVGTKLKGTSATEATVVTA